MAEERGTDKALEPHDLDEFGGREGLPTGEHHAPSPAELAARNKRNLAVALAVVLFVVIVYATTTLRMRDAIEAGREQGGPVFVDERE